MCTSDNETDGKLIECVNGAYYYFGQSGWAYFFGFTAKLAHVDPEGNGGKARRNFYMMELDKKTFCVSCFVGALLNVRWRPSPFII
jgi:hypothetical protein